MGTPRNRKLWLVPVVGILGVGAFTGISQAVDGGDERPEVRSTSSSSTTAARVEDDGTDDISGPCDEAEHVNDPRCTGAAASDDSSGPGPSGDDIDVDDDHSGPGHGGGDDD